MGSILPFAAKQPRPPRSYDRPSAPCEIVIFSGVRIDRPRPEPATKPAPAIAAPTA